MSANASATVFTFAQGYSGENVNVRTQGTAPRSFIQIWHQASAQWCAYYSTDSGGANIYNLYCSTGNPTYNPYSFSYGYAWGWNYNDLTGVIWTAQSTQA